MLMFSLSFFCSCDSRQFSLPQNYIFSGLNFAKDGQITQTIGVGVNSAYLDKNSMMGESVQFKSNLVQQLGILRQKFLVNYAVVYLQNPLEEYKIGSGVKLSDVTYKEECDMVSFDICFASSRAWKYYHSPLQETSDKAKMPAFVAKIANKSLFPFAAQDASGQMVATGYKSLYLKASEGLSFEGELKKAYSPTYVYQYSTYLKSIKSNAVYKTRDSQGQYCHLWVAEEAALDKTYTTIYYYLVNYGNWLLLIVLVPSMALVIYLITIKIKEKKCKKRG